MGPYLSIIFLFFAIIIGNVQCTDIQLDEYIRDMKNLKADFDNIHNKYIESTSNETGSNETLLIQEQQINDFRNKVSHLLNKYKDQEALIKGAIDRSNHEVYRVFNELQQIDAQLGNIRHQINENVITRDIAQQNLNRQHAEIHQDVLGQGHLADIDELNGRRRHAMSQIAALSQQTAQKNAEIANLHAQLSHLEARSRELNALKESYQHFQNKAVPWVNILGEAVQWLQRLQIPLEEANVQTVENPSLYFAHKLELVYANSAREYEKLLQE
uniref:Uncharacterized protein n=1 Tax=Acrobeloides nanus TaxID=290746 RepID=A0A914CEP8_9BILA